MRILANTNYNFLQWRWHALALSLVLITAGATSLYLRGGLPLGIEFTGGTAVVVRFAEPTSEDAVREALTAQGFAGQTIVQRYGPPEANEIVIRLPVIAGQEEGTLLIDEAQRVQEALRASAVGSFEVLSSESIGPVMGREYQQRGIWATIAALAGILLYVAFRFRFSFALGAVVAVFHDILITIIFLSWFQYDVTLNVIAGLLTITGYSVNDTIVIFDRVRENLRQMRREPLEEIINRSVNQTLARTVITSGTTLMAVLCLFLFGGEVLRAFSFTMIVGIITGTYSTLFIAAAVAIVLSRRPATVQAAGRTQGSARAKRA
jgi:preprotein translocase subunit SecF